MRWLLSRGTKRDVQGFPEEAIPICSKATFETSASSGAKLEHIRGLCTCRGPETLRKFPPAAFSLLFLSIPAAQSHPAKEERVKEPYACGSFLARETLAAVPRKSNQLT